MSDIQLTTYSEIETAEQQLHGHLPLYQSNGGRGRHHGQSRQSGVLLGPGGKLPSSSSSHIARAGKVLP